MTAGQYEKSIEILKNVLAQEPNFEPAHVMISISYMFNKSYDLALHHAKKISTKINRYFQYFRIYANQGDLTRAEAILDEYLSHPKVNDFPGALAILYGDLSRMDEAVKWFKKGIEIRSPFVLIHNDWARCDNLLNDTRVKKILRDAGLKE
jgi:tetratricopeptide (TPR) repeat protein